MVKTKKVIEVLGDLLFYTILFTAPMWFLVWIDFNNSIIGVHFTAEKQWYEIGYNIGKIGLGVFGYLVFAYFLKYVFERIWNGIVKKLGDLEEWANEGVEKESKKQKKKDKKEKKKVENNDKNDKTLGSGRNLFRRERKTGNDRGTEPSIVGGSQAKDRNKIPNPETL
jgi:hypothetical protein